MSISLTSDLSNPLKGFQFSVLVFDPELFRSLIPVQFLLEILRLLFLRTSSKVLRLSRKLYLLVNYQCCPDNTDSGSIDCHEGHMVFETGTVDTV